MLHSKLVPVFIHIYMYINIRSIIFSLSLSDVKKKFSKIFLNFLLHKVMHIYARDFLFEKCVIELGVEYEGKKSQRINN